MGGANTQGSTVQVLGEVSTVRSEGLDLGDLALTNGGFRLRFPFHQERETALGARWLCAFALD